MNVSTQPSISTPPTVAGIFQNNDEARKAIDALKQAGFMDEQIGVASREWSKKMEDVRLDEQNTTERGAIAGAIAGGGLGAALGLAGAMLVPGAAPVVGGAALLGVLGGGLAGAAGGVYVGPFIALGFSEHEARRHEEHVKQGKTVVLVHAPGREEEAHAIMIHEGAYDDSMNPSPS